MSQSLRMVDPGLATYRNCSTSLIHLGKHLFFYSFTGKTPHKRTPWQPAEVKAVERHMKAFIHGCTVPSKSDCEKCLRAEPEALKIRDWQNIKFFVYNRITAYKRKMLLK